MSDDRIQIWLVLKAGKAKKVLLLQTTPKAGEFWEPITAPFERGEPLAGAALLWTGKKTGMIFKQSPNSVSETVFYFELSEKPGSIAINPSEYQSFSWMPLKEVDECLKSPAHKKGFSKLVEVIGKK